MRLIATTLVIVLGLALRPAPAHALDDDATAFLAGLITIGILAAAMDQSRSSSKPAAVKTKTDPYSGLTPLGSRGYHGPRKRSTDLPRQCLRDVKSAGQIYRVFGIQCLERSYARADRLPKECIRVAYTPHGKRKVYSPRCLSREGYRVEAARR